MRSSLSGTLILAAFAFVLGGAPVALAAPPEARISLGGPEAAGFALPEDVELVRRIGLAELTQERYQQVFGQARAKVLGGQITVYRDGRGEARLVIGSHYDGIVPSNSVQITAAAAREVAAQDVGRQGTRTVELRIDPQSGRYFYQVETRRFAFRVVHWINAADGRVIRKYDAITHDHGTGVKGDTKDMNGPDNASAADDLTTFHGASGHGASGSHWDLISKDNRQVTFDYRNKDPSIYWITDADDHWTSVTANRQSPGQPAMVDAQFYANVADDYFQSAFGLDWIGDCGYTAMQSVVHYSKNYNNAFWDGAYVVYGDGDGSIFRELSGGLDVAAHELAHGITDCTSDLVYQNESGALNESFSDILGSSAEFFAAEPTSTNCVRAAGQSVCADWWIGEDIYLPASEKPGFRNMADPEDDGDPDHYTERQVGGGDNGGVHTNSGIPNHVHYLLVNGGMNASCANPTQRNSAHCSDADTQDNGLVVTGIGVAKAEQIAFLAFAGLSENATMCNARLAAEAAAAALYGSSSLEKASTSDAWVAVGLTDAECGLAPPPNTPPTADDTSATTDEDAAMDVDLSGSDPEDCELTFSIVDPPANGALGAITDAACTSGSPNTDTATVTYTPDPGFTGDDTFTYRVNDGTDNSNVATATVTVNAASGTDYASVVLADAPAGYWRLGESSGTGAADSSGNGNDGAYVGSPGLGAPGLVAGADTAVDFDAIDDRVTVDDSPSLSPTAAITVEAWVHPDGLPTTNGSIRYIAIKSQAYMLRMERVSDQVRFAFFVYGDGSYGPFVHSGALTIAAGTTYHVVGTYDGSQLRLYINGAEQASTPRTVTINDSLHPLFLGSWGANHLWDGRLDEIAIYNRALSPTEVSEHQQAGSSVVSGYPESVLADGPAGYWRLGESSGTGAADSSGNGNDGAYVGSPGLGAPGLVAGADTAVDFDAIDDRVTVDDSPSLSPTAAITVEAWVHPDGLPTTNGSIRYIAIKSQAYMLRMERVSDQVRFAFFVYGDGSYGPFVHSGALTIAAGTTYHVVGTYDGSQLRLYINGAEQASTPRTVTINDSLHPLFLGSWGANHLWDGRLDEIAIYLTALTGSAIGQHYAAGTG